MIWLALAAILFFIFGILIRDGHIYPDESWSAFGRFLIYVSFIFFLAMVIFSIIGVLIKK